MLTGVWIAIIVAGGLFCLAGLLVGYLGLLATLFPEKLRTREVGTVVTPDLWQLRICRFRRGRTEGEPVLLVHGMCANHHNFTEPEGACLVDYLVERGYDCWALDLRGTRSSKAPFERDPMEVHLDDYLLHDIPAAIEHIRRATGYAKIHYIGHSLGGMLLYAYVQEFGADQIASGVAMGAPLGFDGVRARVGVALLPFVKRFPLFAADLLRGMLPVVAPLRLPVPAFPLNGRNVHPGLKVRHFYNMIDIPQPHVLSELVHMLKRRVWRMKGDTLDVKAGLSRMNFPLLAIYGPRDPFIPLEVARDFVDKLPHEDKEILICCREGGARHDHGHCDLAFAVDGERTVFRPIAEWLERHSIKERLGPSAEVEAHLMTPLDDETRASVLSGVTYQKAELERLAPAPVEEAPAPPEAVTPDETSPVMQERLAALRGIAEEDTSQDDETAPEEDTATEAEPAAKAPRRKAAAKKPAAKTTATAKAAAAKAAPARRTAVKLVEVSSLLEKIEDKPAPAKKKSTAKAAKVTREEPTPEEAAHAKPPARKAAGAESPAAPATEATHSATAAAKPKPGAKSAAKAKAKAAAAKTAAKTETVPAAAPPAKPKATAKPKAKAAPRPSSGTLDVLKAASEELKKLDKAN